MNNPKTLAIERDAMETMLDHMAVLADPLRCRMLLGSAGLTKILHSLSLDTRDFAQEDELAPPPGLSIGM